MPGLLKDRKSWNSKKPSSIHVAVMETTLQVKGHRVTVSPSFTIYRELLFIKEFRHFMSCLKMQQITIH